MYVEQGASAMEYKVTIPPNLINESPIKDCNMKMISTRAQMPNPLKVRDSFKLLTQAPWDL